MALSVKTHKIKNIVLKNGADCCGIANVESFNQAPEGFKPQDIYSKCKSVLVFANRIPVAAIHAESCIPYTHINDIAMQKMDKMTLEISLSLQQEGISSIVIPTDDPYEYWEPENTYGRAILSLRHAGYLAGLGYLGKNTLLIHKTFGNMIQIGALLLDIALEADQVIKEICPENCNLCLDNCPVYALDGITVNQKLCRPLSVYKNLKGYTLKKCYKCRKICPRMSGY